MQAEKGDRFISPKAWDSDFLCGAALGSFQGVQFEGVFLDLFLDVRGEIAGSFGPFDRGLAVSLAKNARGVLRRTIAPLTGFHNGVTSPTVVGAAALLHEDALRSRFVGLALHGNRPPFIM
jgi:hypothetical protein